MPRHVSMLGWFACGALVCVFGAAGAACGGAQGGAGGASTAASGGGAGVGGNSSGAGSIVQVACGDFHSCARTAEGKVLCWGRNRSGELGDQGRGGPRKERPTAIDGLEGAQEIALGAAFGCARLRDGTVRCWGSGKIIGDDTTLDKAAPTLVRGVSDAVEIRAGGFIACARTASGAARCWGLEAVRKGGPEKGVGEVAAASSHACARMEDGTVRCWGEGAWGGGNGTRASGTDVSFATGGGVKGVRTLATGDSFVCVGPASGAPQCWGRNDQGELGVNPDSDNHVTPVTVRGVPGPVARLSSAESATCAISADASVRCWGDNSDGELGRGSPTTQELPAPVTDLDKAVDVAVGADHACAIAKDNSVRCWGANREGQVGDGTTEPRFTATKISF